MYLFTSTYLWQYYLRIFLNKIKIGRKTTKKESHGKIKHSSMFAVCLLICLLAQLYWIVMFVLKRVTNIDKNRKSDSISTTYLSSYFLKCLYFILLSLLID